jgi:hypothetical protein
MFEVSLRLKFSFKKIVKIVKKKKKKKKTVVLLRALSWIPAS